ncbi:WhiB family transcriptional regulator [Streptomyces sp. NPDC059918]|uniref:WhiB family transcriptional regulator n=1 Tax=unclassified Streptomyces TaxID=2593676 RepID=UPI00364C5ED7
MPARQSLPSFVPRTDHVGTLPCAEPGVDPDLIFFSDTNNSVTIRAAQLMCARCPVLLACRSHARSQREWGIWGGEPESARDVPPAGRSAARHKQQAALAARRAARGKTSAA